MCHVGHCSQHSRVSDTLRMVHCVDSKTVHLQYFDQLFISLECGDVASILDKPKIVMYRNSEFRSQFHYQQSIAKQCNISHRSCHKKLLRHYEMLETNHSWWSTFCGSYVRSIPTSIKYDMIKIEWDTCIMTQSLIVWHLDTM